MSQWQSTVNGMFHCWAHKTGNNLFKDVRKNHRIPEHVCKDFCDFFCETEIAFLGWSFGFLEWEVPRSCVAEWTWEMCCCECEHFAVIFGSANVSDIYSERRKMLCAIIYFQRFSNWASNTISSHRLDLFHSSWEFWTWKRKNENICSADFSNCQPRFWNLFAKLNFLHLKLWISWQFFFLKFTSNSEKETEITVCSTCSLCPRCTRPKSEKMYYFSVYLKAVNLCMSFPSNIYCHGLNHI